MSDSRYGDRNGHVCHDGFVAEGGVQGFGGYARRRLAEGFTGDIECLAQIEREAGIGVVLARVTCRNIASVHGGERLDIQNMVCADGFVLRVLRQMVLICDSREYLDGQEEKHEQDDQAAHGGKKSFEASSIASVPATHRSTPSLLNLA